MLYIDSIFNINSYNMRRYVLLVTAIITLYSCSSSSNNNKDNGENTHSIDSLNEKQVNYTIPDREIELFGFIKRDFNNKEYVGVSSRSEEFYKEFRLSDKMDSVEFMYEAAIDALESQEMKEYGSLAFKRHKLTENPILNPSPAMSAPADGFLDRFVGRSSEFAELVKSQIKEPDSFEYIDTKYMNKKSGYIALVMRFKAKNGIGNVVEREALGKFDKVTEQFNDIKIIE